MPIQYESDRALFSDVATVEEAETLLAWMQGREDAKLDLQSCTHLHSAVLQVLMAADHRITSWPADASLRRWLETALKSG